ncbi:MAG: histidinol-phosphate transaminase [Candidatus Bathyarchaeota archaeon]|nr:MAG: histidinol-phosphate transaminase [Candidatus Bathyarchaeota archaeon]
MGRRKRFEQRLTEIMQSHHYRSGEYSVPNERYSPNDWIKLNANENLFLQQAFFAQQYHEYASKFDPRLYPQTEKIELIQSLAKYLSLPAECFTIGNGSDDLIETVVKAFLRPSERCLSISPTFTMYRIIVENHGGVYETVPLDASFSIRSQAFLNKVKDDTTLCILCSPNNPTGNQLEHSMLLEIIEEFEGLVIVDEAYAEFAPYSIHREVLNHENLIVLRTFSKAFGLAGLRIGYACAAPKLTAALRQRQLPYNVNKFSMRIATAILQNPQLFLETVDTIKTERCKFITSLNHINGVKAFPSDANFVLITTEKDADSVFTELKSRKLLVRQIGTILNHGKCLRITVGPAKTNLQLIRTLEEICA